jgi:hypothetical protein
MTASTWARIAAALAVAVTMASIPASAAYYSREHGVSCAPTFDGKGVVGVGEPGIGNYSSAQSARVFCASGRTFYDATSITVYYTDTSAAATFWCYGWATNLFTGSMVWTPKKYTCATFGGCLDPTTAFTGHSSLTLNFPAATYGMIGFSCSIPPSSGYASWVTGGDFLSTGPQY